MPTRKPAKKTPQTPQTPPLTPTDVESAKHEVTLFYDLELQRRAAVIAELEEKLAEARALRDDTAAARAVWLDSGVITRNGKPIDPGGWEYRNLCTEVVLSAGSRAMRVRLPLVRRIAGAPGAVISPEERAAADAANAQADLLKRWMRDSGFPLLDGI
jgi:hypothetical protein